MIFIATLFYNRIQREGFIFILSRFSLHMKGVFNKVLQFDLSSNSQKEIPLADEIYENFIGGRGLGVKLLTDRLAPKTDPLSPRNVLIFTTGPLTATTVPTAGRTSLVTKSPLTGGIFYSNSGGFIAPFLKELL